MKSIIRYILKEESQKYSINDVILKDLLNTFNKDTIQHSNPAYFYRYENMLDIVNTKILPHIEDTYHLNMKENDDQLKTIFMKWIREMYHHEYPIPGDTIEMVKMVDPDPILPGTRGVVDRVKSHNWGSGNFEEHVFVYWENGRTLKVILPEDKIKIVNENT